jgi:IS5 family transposase
VPERTAFVRFRRVLIATGLDRAVFEAVTAQLRAKAVTVKTGAIVDATIIASASDDDAQARWVKHKTKPAVHGFKAHVGADAQTALVEKASVTPANVHDGRAGFAALPLNPGEVFADSAYRGQVFAEAVRAKGGTPRLVASAMRGRDEPETLGKLKAHNRPIHQVRAGSRKHSGPGNEATASGACDGGASPRQPPRSSSPPSPTTSSAP